MIHSVACSPLGRVLLAPKRTLLLRSFVAVDVDIYLCIVQNQTLVLPSHYCCSKAVAMSGTVQTISILAPRIESTLRLVRLSSTLLHAAGCMLHCISEPDNKYLEVKGATSKADACNLCTFAVHGVLQRIKCCC
jgi:hypothetical protein